MNGMRAAVEELEVLVVGGGVDEPDELLAMGWKILANCAVSVHRSRIANEPIDTKVSRRATLGLVTPRTLILDTEM
jgi:hypothetical protein